MVKLKSKQSRPKHEGDGVRRLRSNQGVSKPAEDPQDKKHKAPRGRGRPPNKRPFVKIEGEGASEEVIGNGSAPAEVNAGANGVKQAEVKAPSPRNAGTSNAVPESEASTPGDKRRKRRKIAELLVEDIRASKLPKLDPSEIEQMLAKKKTERGSEGGQIVQEERGIKKTRSKALEEAAGDNDKKEHEKDRHKAVRETRLERALEGEGARKVKTKERIQREGKINGMALGEGSLKKKKVKDLADKSINTEALPNDQRAKEPVHGGGGGVSQKGFHVKVDKPHYLELDIDQKKAVDFPEIHYVSPEDVDDGTNATFDDWKKDCYYYIALRNRSGERVRAEKDSGLRIFYELISKKSTLKPFYNDYCTKPERTGYYCFRVPNFVKPGKYFARWTLVEADDNKALVPPLMRSTRVCIGKGGSRGGSPVRKKKNKHKKDNSTSLRNRNASEGESKVAKGPKKRRFAEEESMKGVEGDGSRHNEAHGGAAPGESMALGPSLEPRRKRPVVNLIIPDRLRNFMLEDWYNVTRKRRIVPLARSPTVSEIVQEFLQVREKPTNKFWPGKICVLFDGIIGNLLLYRFERHQYQTTMDKHKNKKPPHLIYGAEHLLRLLALVPKLMKYGKEDAHKGGPSNPEAEAIFFSSLEIEAQEAQDFFQDLLRFLDAQYDRMFLKEYEEPNERYGIDVPSFHR